PNLQMGLPLKKIVGEKRVHIHAFGSDHLNSLSSSNSISLHDVREEESHRPFSVIRADDHSSSQRHLPSNRSAAVSEQPQQRS
ncbi:hypothetical protein PMAYCL1PPCAC_30660, partial [Pristionchus mayeri]